MRELTFSGFLRNYVCSLSASRTCSLYKLAKEAAEENPRLREPLFLYALFTDSMERLLRATRKTKLAEEYGSLADNYDKTGLESALKDASSRLPEEYKKVWRSYLSKKNRWLHDNGTKELIRTRVMKLQNMKGVSNYRIYVDLRLNHGNLNAWLRNGDSSKVSLDTARLTLKYMESMTAER